MELGLEQGLLDIVALVCGEVALPVSRVQAVISRSPVRGAGASRFPRSRCGIVNDYYLHAGVCARPKAVKRT